jgi:hypothetical protein
MSEWPAVAWTDMISFSPDSMLLGAGLSNALYGYFSFWHWSEIRMVVRTELRLLEQNALVWSGFKKRYDNLRTWRPSSSSSPSAGTAWRMKYGVRGGDNSHWQYPDSLGALSGAAASFFRHAVVGCSDYDLVNRRILVQFPEGTRILSFFFSKRSDRTGAHTASNSVGTEGSFSGSKAAGVWPWPLTTI